jgi:hypothetical protein
VQPRHSFLPDAEEADLIRRLNDYRQRAGLSSLTVSPSLMAAASWKSNDLGTSAYFSHDDFGRSWLQRLRDCGYADTVNVAENLAAANSDGAATFEQWRTSAGHNANFLNPSMRAVGVARAFVPGSPFGWYWTADFGAVVDGSTAPLASPPPPAPPSRPGIAADGSGASSSRLAVGSTAFVTGTGDCLRVHDAPTLSASMVVCLPDGTAMVVSAGPIAADGFTWWKLGSLGWVVAQYLTAAP